MYIIIYKHIYNYEQHQRHYLLYYDRFLVTVQTSITLYRVIIFKGKMIALQTYGYFCFRYGRKSIFVICILLMSISGAVQVVSPEYVTFVSLVFINALGTAGVYPLAFIIGKIIPLLIFLLISPLNVI